MSREILGGVFGRDEQGRPWHELTFRVTVLDTDVFNLSWERYLPWCERNATELHNALGITNAKRRETGSFSVLRGLETHYRQPAFLDDVVRLRSTITKVGNSSEVFSHNFLRNDTVLMEASGTLVWVSEASGKAIPIPDWSRYAIATGGQPDAAPSTQHSAPSAVLGGVFRRNEQGEPCHYITFRTTVLDTDVINLSWERYLPWAERNATELNVALGISNAKLREVGLGMYMSGFTVDYRQPAYLDDIITIESAVEGVSGARVAYRHRFFRGDTLLVESRGALVWVDLNTQRPVRVPEWVQKAVTEGQ